MRRLGFVLLSAWGFLACSGGNQPECEPSEELLVFADEDRDGFGREIIGYRCRLEQGQSTNNVDCNDTDASVFPGAVEICDNLDNDCDGGLDEGFNPIDYYLDADADGFGDPNSLLRTCDDPGAAYVFNDSDCNDEFDTVNPDAIDCPNYMDDDCNGIVDDQVESSCGDNLDNDCDGLSDCDDSDCSTTPFCLLPCADYVIQGDSLPVTFSNSTVDPLPNGDFPEDNYIPPLICQYYFSNNAPDVVVQWTVPETGNYSIDTAGSDFNTVLTIYVDDCPMAGYDQGFEACNDNDGINVTSRIDSIFLSSGAQIAIVVDGSGYGTDRGNFTINIEEL
ncbi:MAG: putative metal-binding motif-containing protein [Myxococcota bacterium]